MRDRRISLLITCEHASNRFPSAYRDVERRAGAVLNTHRAYDPGAVELARRVARRFDAPLFVGKWSRLLIELNRSLHHRSLFSEFSKTLSDEEREELIESYYLPYRTDVTNHIRSEINAGRRVLHIGVHSFTPELNGEVRTADIGFLYDPSRKSESLFCAEWLLRLKAARPDLVVRRNYPYRGTADGFTTALRALFGNRDYQGIELEVNQRFPMGPPADWRKLQADIVGSFNDRAVRET